MCGRITCALDPDDICSASVYEGKDGRRLKPVWKEAPCNRRYHPSYNISPGANTPVMLSSRHYKNNEVDEDVERVIQPMKWGLVPTWHKGDPYKLEYNTYNCRGESLLTTRSYKVPLEKGNRCIVLVNGFYEWKYGTGIRQPYYIYPKDEQTTNTSELKTPVKGKGDPSGSPDDKIKDDNYIPSSIEDECKGNSLLTLAGVFEVWKQQDGSDEMYSYSIITVAASPSMAGIHHRMPAILNTDEDVNKWLDVDNVPLSEACKLIRPTENVTMHPVSSIVNNPRHNSPECVLNINLQTPKKSTGLQTPQKSAGFKAPKKSPGFKTPKKSPSQQTPKTSPSSNFMMNWLGKTDEPSPKRPKTQ